nr:12148_t:CDS:2 [Entrophospora candida]
MSTITKPSSSRISNIDKSTIQSCSKLLDEDEDENFEATTAKEPYETKYIKLSNIEALDFFFSSDQSTETFSDVVLILIHKAINLAFVLCMVSCSLAAGMSLIYNRTLNLFSFNTSWSIFYIIKASIWAYCSYRLNSSLMSLKDAIMSAKRIAIPFNSINENPLFYSGTVFSLPFFLFLEELLEAYEKESFRKRALLKVERENAQKSVYKAIDRITERKASYLKVIACQLKQTTDLAIKTLKQLSPADFLTQPHEQLSACSISFPTTSIKAIHTSLKAVNYISSHLDILSLLLFTDVHNAEEIIGTSNIRREFDIGEMIQNVADALAGVAALARVELVVYHIDYGLEHLNVIGDVAGFRHALLDFIKCIFDGASPGACVELGLQIRTVDNDEKESVIINPHDKVIIKVEIIHNASTLIPSDGDKPVLVCPDANLTFKVLNYLGATLTVDEEDHDHGRQRFEITIEMEAGSSLNTSNNLKVNEEMYHRYPNLRITGEPSVEELIKTSQLMGGQRVALFATSKSFFAKHITSCLTTWGTNISHVPIGGNQDDSSNLPPTFIMIDDDIDTLKQHLKQLSNAPFTGLSSLSSTMKSSLAMGLGVTGLGGNGGSSNSRTKKPPPSLPSQTTAVIYFTSITKYKLVKDSIQDIVSSNNNGTFTLLPQILVIPKPVGPRRFLTAFHTTINQIVVDPVYIPIATSPKSPMDQVIMSDSSNNYFSFTRAASSSSTSINSTPTNRPKNDSSSSASCPVSPKMQFNYKKASNGSDDFNVDYNNINDKNDNKKINNGNGGGSGGGGDNNGSIEVGGGNNNPIPLSVGINTGGGNTIVTTHLLSPSQPPSIRTQIPSPLGSTLPILNSPQEHDKKSSSASTPLPKQVSPKPNTKSQNSQSSKFTRNARAGKNNRKIPTNSEYVIPPINVLIVEDNPINQAILSTFMRKKKIKYECATNGQEAVDKWKEGGFHLVLMDIQLPVMDGIKATETIRKLEKHQQIGVLPSSSISQHDQQEGGIPSSTSISSTPTTTMRSPVIILALTASSLSSDRKNALAAGCNDFLTKPVSLEWLEKKILDWGCMQALIDFDVWRKWKKDDDSESAKAIEPRKNQRSISTAQIQKTRTYIEENDLVGKKTIVSPILTKNNSSPSVLGVKKGGNVDDGDSKTTESVVSITKLTTENLESYQPVRRSSVVSPVTSSPITATISSNSNSSSSSTIISNLPRTPTGGVIISPANMIPSLPSTPKNFQRVVKEITSK